MRKFKLAGIGFTVGVVGGRIGMENPPESVRLVERIARRNGVILQIFDADLVAGEVHLVQAARKAMLALESGNTRANSPSLELMCWAAAEGQISEAIKRLGVQSSTKKVALVAVGRNGTGVGKSLREAVESLGIREDPAVLELTPRKRRLIREKFGIGKAELKTAPLEMLVLERIAGLAL